MSAIARFPVCFLAWAVAAGATAHALDSESLHRAAEYSAAHQGKALLVIRNGETLLASYTNGGAPLERRKIYSGTKAFWVMAALAAREQGILELDERVSDTIREWHDTPKERIRLRDLLNFTEGIDPMFHLHSDAYPNRNTVALGAPVVAEPGARFIYGPAALQVFEEVLRRKLARKGETPVRYLEEKVLQPLHLGRQDYKLDAAGNPLLATGFRMTAEEWSRMGKLLLNSGAPVISPRSFELAIRGTAANPAFGMGLWNNQEAASGQAREFDIEDMLELDWVRQDWSHACICRDAPPDLIAAIGSGYQRLYVIPSMNLIAVRLGTGGRFSDGEFLRDLLGR